MSSRYRRYDHRIKNMIAQTGDPNLFPDLAIPLSTAREWIKKGPQKVVSISSFDFSKESLIEENQKLQNDIESVKIEQDLVIKTFRIFGFQLQYRRLPKEEFKKDLISSIKAAAKRIPLTRCLDLIGLSRSRYTAWINREKDCLLADRSSCPQLTPTRLTSSEISSIKSMIEDPDLRHFSILSLCWLGKRTGEVFASVASWYRIMHECGLKRSGERKYPDKPRVGMRASFPHQYWHIDMSVIRLKNGTRCFIQAVMDNFSRYVLAWQVSLDFGGLRSKELLGAAILKAKELGMKFDPILIMDSGCENLNHQVDLLLNTASIRRLIAQIDIEFSNSMIEALFHRLKNRYLYLQDLTDFNALKAHVDWYLTDSNERIPHPVLNGATPLEVITGRYTSEDLAKLKAAEAESRLNRIRSNQNLSCAICL